MGAEILIERLVSGKVSLYNPVNSIHAAKHPSITLFTHFCYITVSNASVCPKTPQKRPIEGKGIQQKTFCTLYLLPRERMRLPGKPEKEGEKIHSV